MNQVCLVGRITAKPELRQTPNGIATTRFNLAVNRQYAKDGKRETDFIPVQVWRKQAENICQYLDKGSQVSIEGRIQTGTYKDKDGNNRSTWVVVANNVQFLENKKSGQASDIQTPQRDTEQVDIYAEFGDEIDVDDNEFLD